MKANLKAQDKSDNGLRNVLIDLATTQVKPLCFFGAHLLRLNHSLHTQMDHTFNESLPFKVITPTFNGYSAILLMHSKMLVSCRHWNLSHLYNPSHIVMNAAIDSVRVWNSIAGIVYDLQYGPAMFNHLIRVLLWLP